jgi:type VI secretion system protein ImpE
MPAHLQFENGGETLALIPTRYEGTEKVEDGELRLARKTEWRELRPEVWAGYGQRVLGSDAGEYALMDVREILFTQAADTSAGEAEEGSVDG